MALEPVKQDNFDIFQEEYSRPRNQAVRQAERAVFGHEVGLNGYTTLEQAWELCDHLKLTVDDYLLDLGGGRGWPGLHIAQESHCGLVSTDIPLDALREAKVNVEARVLHSDVEVIAADGRALPFRSECFDAIVHADVFC
ncbi:class I SAM-dependent methyltransferase [candidate division KSB1 bacterium]|nr:class I SAM-dependent methyltransferase [candidate division KSB1 bacterium]NIS23901.1 class I SAM-dependent methyltransferase [candidate division KSB1 bacterium]NIT70818.1 class I SAM-dependent methyltransferase [candidate division KSB1 bacterium]NIU24550.1 class I SAM-dependent methyltransferase [candidate division KSB1 bacterium]NIU94504.1 methyltransferase domain-containing protein [candidate division KSB1 bacterium]